MPTSIVSIKALEKKYGIDVPDLSQQTTSATRRSSRGSTTTSLVEQLLRTAGSSGILTANDLNGSSALKRKSQTKIENGQKISLLINSDYSRSLGLPDVQVPPAARRVLDLQA